MLNCSRHAFGSTYTCTCGTRIRVTTARVGVRTQATVLDPLIWSQITFLAAPTCAYPK